MWFFYLVIIAMIGGLLSLALQLKMSHDAHQAQVKKPAAARATSTSDMDVSTAHNVLGLPRGARKKEIIAAHRRLIRHMHPDHGGSAYLASQINLAKDTLLRNHSRLNS